MIIYFKDLKENILSFIHVRDNNNAIIALIVYAFVCNAFVPSFIIVLRKSVAETAVEKNMV